MHYIQSVGIMMILTNLFIILYREVNNCAKTAFYYGYTEIYLFNIIICVFVMRRAEVCII